MTERRLRRALAAVLAFAAWTWAGGPFGFAQPLYWEYPRTLAEGRFPSTLQVKDGFVVLWQESTPDAGPLAATSGSASVKLARFAGGTWEAARPVSGKRYGIHYDSSGREPLLFSSAVSEDGRLAVAIADAEGRMDILLSPDGGRSFSSVPLALDHSFSVAPRIYPSASGGWILFVAQGESPSPSAAAGAADQGAPPASIFPIYYSTSADAASWSPFKPLLGPTDDGIDLSFAAVASPLPQAPGGAATDIVVFQGLTASQRPSWQLFAKLSIDGGKNWSAATRITDFPDPLTRDRTAGAPDNYDNRGASLGTVDGKLWAVWQRSTRGSPQTQIYIGSFSADGGIDPRSVDRISSGSGTCILPQVAALDGKPAASWIDNRRGSNRLYLNVKGLTRDERDLSQDTGAASFGRLVSDGKRSHAIWQVSGGRGDRIIDLEPDTSVEAPRLAALDFTPGARTPRERAIVKVNVPDDSSGIMGYSFVWSRDPAAEPPLEVMASASDADTRLAQIAREDGPWYLAARVQDIAGNWSRTSRISFVRKLTPPRPPLVFHPELDERGFLASNTFTVGWGPPEKETIAGYTWELRYAGPLEGAGASSSAVAIATAGRNGAASSAASSAVAGPAAAGRGAGAKAPLPGLGAYESALVERAGPPLPPRRIMTTEARASWDDVDDGYYLLSVAAVDDVGNIGDASTILLRANKYVPYTLVNFFDAKADDLGRSSLSVVGKGFAADGRVERVVLDRDGREPYDIERRLADGGFRLRSDTQIDGFAFQDAEAGTYRIGVFHSKRGWYWTRPIVGVDVSGTIKYGLASDYVPSWMPVAPRTFRFSVYDAFVLAIVLFAGLGIFLSSSQALAAAREGAEVRLQVLALVNGGPMPSASKAREERKLRRRGVGLRVKFTLTIASLVLFVVFLVAVPLGVSVIRTQSASLALGLQQRAQVLLESVAQGARTYLPNQDSLQLSFLPQQKRAMQDAGYVTITGYAKRAAEPDAVWASNDEALKAKIDTPELDAGSSRIKDELSPKIAAIVAEIDKAAAAEVGDINKSISDLTREALSLSSRITTDQAARRRYEEIQATVVRFRGTLNDRLFDLAGKSTGAVPAFDPAALELRPTKFIFYKPVLYVQTNDQLYYRGMVRIEVSTAGIVADVQGAQSSIIRITLVIAAVALGIGIVGAFILSTVIVVPIRKLVAQIGRIRDTEDKEELEGERIEVKSRDELYTLAETVNQMTEGLVHAAKASKELVIGKGIQKMFIPLDPAPGTRAKLSTGRRDERDFEIFGYYEGAKGVSGDYWDFRSINDRYHYFIKCDISGKGVSAALIMVQVATMVINYFNDWKKAMPRSFDLSDLTYKINDFIEERGFVGRFAAFTLGIWDSKEGVAYLCEAGDRKLHVWDAARRAIVEELLPDSPTAGTFPSFMLQMRTPYTQVTRALATGDILMLYTDGIEEAKRYFRDRDFKVMPCADAEKDQPHDNHAGGQDNEEFGYDRLRAVIEAVDAKGSYRLSKHHDPVRDGVLSFDFSSCAGTLEEKIIALIAVEKIFRMYPDPSATDQDLVLVDEKVDDFLKKHFDQYRLYFSKNRPYADENNPGYRLYAGLKEDPQYDDLTILGIRRK